MATKKAAKPAPEAKPAPAETCKHQWMTIMGDDPYHTKVICVRCGKEGDQKDD